MMHALWQKKLELHYSKDVLDIIQFGSSTLEGKQPRDIDIAVLFQKIPIKTQLEQAQMIKQQLQKNSEISVHITSLDLYSLFNEANFARESILLNGISLLSGFPFAARFGLLPRIHIHYSLVRLQKKDKIRFHYMLQGKKGRYGLLRQYHGKLLQPGLIEIQPQHEHLFLEAIRLYNVSIKVEKIFLASS